MHLVSVWLHLVCANDRDKVVFLQDLLHRFQAKLHGTLALRVLGKTHFTGFFVIHGIGPEKVAEESMERWFDESVDVVDVGFIIKVWRYSTMHAQIVTIYICGNREGFKRVNKELVDLLFKLLQNLVSKSEVFSHGATLVVASEHKDALWVVQLNSFLKIDDLP